MQNFEYTVIPSPERSEKAKGMKTGAERFAFTLTGVLNDMASEGWEYLRAETLPSEERSGLTSRTTVWHNVLVFRRALKPVSRHDDQTRARDAVPPAPVATPTPVSAPTTPVSATPAPTTRVAREPRAEPRVPGPASGAAPGAAPTAPPFSAAPPVRLDQPSAPRLGPADR